MHYPAVLGGADAELGSVRSHIESLAARLVRSFRDRRLRAGGRHPARRRRNGVRMAVGQVPGMRAPAEPPAAVTA